MPRQHPFRTPLLALLPALVIAACTGDPGTAPSSPDYAMAKPVKSTGITMTDLVLTTSTLTVGQDNTADYTVTITNGRAKKSLAVLQGSVVQTRPSDNGLADQPAGGSNVLCTGVSGELPHGSCTTGFSINLFNRPEDGPALESGAATFHVDLIDESGAVLASAEAPVTVVVP